MRNRPYRHDAAQILRGGERARAELALAQATGALAAAEAARMSASEALELHARTAAPTKSGRSDGAELARRADYLRRHNEQQRVLTEALAQATAGTQAARAGVEDVRAGLARARGREQLLEQDRARFDADERRRAADADDEETQEAHGRGRR